MAFPTTNAVTELPAVNQILASCGQAPATTLDQTNPDVAIAYSTLLYYAYLAYHIVPPVHYTSEYPDIYLVIYYFGPIALVLYPVINILGSIFVV